MLFLVCVLHISSMSCFLLLTHFLKGLKVNAVLVHEGVDIDRQIYLAFILDRNTQGPALIASKFGGMEIEEVAREHPESIIFHPIDIKLGLSDKDARKVAEQLDLGQEPFLSQAVEQMKNIYKMFLELDSTQVEINPWATDPKKLLWCIDAKINVDDNAKFRQTELGKFL